MKRKGYVSQIRDTRVAQTKSRILEAAKELIRIEGFDSITINKLAEASGISRQWTYSLFKSRRGVLQSLLDQAAPPEQFVAFEDQSNQEESPENHLRIIARITRQIYDAETELMDILRGASFVAPEFKALEEENEKRRYERQGESIKKMMKKKSLSKGLTFQKAVDVLWALTDRNMYRMFVVERGWSPDEYEKWLEHSLIKHLLK